MPTLRTLTCSLAAAALITASSHAAADPSPDAATRRARIDVVFVLDTTGSMGGLIEGAKQKIWSIANRVASARGEPEVRMGLVAYRDRGDAYVTDRLELTGDIDAVYERLRGLRAEGGGDTPESVNQALHEAVTAMGWREGDDVYRVVFLVGDAPPHRDYADDEPYTASLELAARRGIVVNAIQCGSLAETAPIWQEIARRGEGEYARIGQDGGMAAIATPVDDELAALNRALAATALPYGSAQEQASLARKLARAAEAAAPLAADRLGYLDKTGGRVAAGRGDLVDAVRAGELDPGTLPEAELPAEMRGLDAEARRAYVDRRQQERAQLATRVGALVMRRDAFVRAEVERLEREGRGDGFDAKVLSAIRRQAADKGIAYE
jgi:Mg-chelatase subunit ChlD